MTRSRGGAPIDLPDRSVLAAHQRGPLRPERLLSVRARQSRRLSGHRFRAADLALIAGTVLASLAWSSPSPLLDVPVGDAAPFVIGGVVLAAVLRGAGQYRFARSEGLVAHLLRVAASVAVAAVAATVTAVATRSTGDSGGPGFRRVAAWSGLVIAGLLILHLTWWLLVRSWRANGWLTPNVVIIGATSQATRIIADALPSRSVHVLGVFDDRLARSPGDVLGVPVLGGSEALLTHKITPFVDLVVVSVDPAATARVRELADRLATLPNEITLLVDQRDERARANALQRLGDAPLAPLTRGVDADRKAFAKRIQDLVIGLPMLLLAAPVLALIAVAVRLDSPGPVLFRQIRHGFNNEDIVVWKFRTMRRESADPRAQRQVTADDQRITRVGRILRSTSLDELPQLVNVIRGEMSLVGPRPHAIGMMTGEVESSLLVAEYAHRHRIKPGMTGWAAIRGSRGPLHRAEEVRDRVVLDIDYINRQSFWLDLQIMMKTIPSVFGDRSVVR